MHVEEIAEQFQRRFGRAPEVGARAPGRVNLIGEHTDYNEGLVLPCAIDRDTRVLAARRDDARIRVYSRERDELAEFAADALQRRGDWLDYVQAVVFALAERGIPVPGLDIAVASDVPLESGLSSSAALGVALATALDRMLDLSLGAIERARIAHRGECDFVGVGCGIMDPFASALGRRDHALRIDCRSQRVTPVRLPRDRLRILIVHSGVRRALAKGGYVERRDECLAAAAEARAAGLAADSLRDFAESDLPALERVLTPSLLRRARHVIRENARVERFCEALDRADLASCGALLREGMRSLREDFEVSTAELDALCELGDAQPGVYGSRLTGAGFGGCTLHLVRPEAVDAAVEGIVSGFEKRFGCRPRLWVTVASDGAGLLDL